MILDITFSESNLSFNPKFGEIHEVSDGGYERGYATGYEQGNQEGYTKGHTEGSQDGYTNGYAEGYSIGESKGYSNGYNVGKTDGETECKNQMQSTIDGLVDKTVVSIESNALQIPQMGLYSCGKLETVIFPNLESIGSMAMYGCRVLTKAVMPNLKTIEASGMHDCNILPELDCRLERLDSNAFCGCQRLSKLIIRTETVCKLNGDPFMATPMQSGTGYIYVPDNLVDSYKSTDIWSTYASQIKPLSELEGGK